MPSQRYHYMFTLSPSVRTLQYARLKFKNPNQCVFIDDKNIILNTFSKAKIRSYICYPEFDDNGRLHYHGTVYVTVSQRVSLFKCVIPTMQRHFNFIKFEIVKHPVEAVIYCKKSFYQTKAILEIDQPIAPCISSIRLGGRRGFKSQIDLDANSDKNCITTYFGI